MVYTPVFQGANHPHWRCHAAYLNAAALMPEIAMLSESPMSPPCRAQVQPESLSPAQRHCYTPRSLEGVNPPGRREQLWLLPRAHAMSQVFAGTSTCP